MEPKKTIILASQSRDRKRLLSNANIPHIVIVSDYKERNTMDLSSTQLCILHAKGKAYSVRLMLEKNPILIQTPQYVIIAADTIVDFRGELIGKAENISCAKEILQKLMGNTHVLMTGVVIYDSESDTTVEYIDKTDVKFAELSDEEIENYVTYSDEYKWRAGSYSMFDRASVFIESISGSPSNVIGLPMSFVYQQLKKFGINILKLKK
ncbi:MAG: septum formation protein Maf [Candidatus Lokiarchaeota archaeon]|nr:septum formation protein Maf [Candidatus Lokiarchaeota archaeon]